MVIVSIISKSESDYIKQLILNVTHYLLVLSINQTGVCMYGVCQTHAEDNSRGQWSGFFQFGILDASFFFQDWSC